MEFPRSHRLELELTSNCTLSCPQCPRVTRWDKRHEWHNGNIDSSALEDAIDDHVQMVAFAGSYGDGIYHKNFVDVLAMMKRKGLDISVDTNGSYIKQDKWNQIAEVISDMGTSCRFTFSIDGPHDNFTTYRVNGNWPSIEMGIRTLAKAGVRRLVWKYIVFKYNSSYEDIKRAYDKAWELGCRGFQLVHTQRTAPGQFVPVEDFTHNLDRLEDYVAELMGTNWNHNKPPRLQIQIHPRVRKTNKQDTKRIGERKNKKRNVIHTMNVEERELYQTEKVKPQCMNVTTWLQFIGSDGIYYPCCYLRTDKQMMIDSLELTEEDVESMSIYNHSIDEIVKGSGYKKLVAGFDKIATCRKKCGR